MRSNRPEHLFTDSQFEQLCIYFTSITGNKLDASKRSLVESRLRRHIMNSGFKPESYLKLVRHDETENALFLSALTTHKTDWFRERIHFEFLKNVIRSAEKDSRQPKGRPWQIWSAACSTGEEVYTAGMVLLEAGISNFRILGTDLSRACLSSANEGIYKREIVERQVSPQYRQQYFRRINSSAGIVEYQISDELKKRCKWRCLNLMHPSLPSKIMFDFVFLRNALIYFDAETAHRVVGNVSHHLPFGGHLIVGLSETISKADSLGLKRIENSVYRK